MSRYRGNQRQQTNGRQQEQNGGNEPVYARSYFSSGGYVNIAVFENYVNGQNGERLVYGFKVKRSYKDDKGEYKDTASFQEGDLAVLAMALSNAAAWIDNQQRQ